MPKVLVIDDDLTYFDLLRDNLEARGHDVVGLEEIGLYTQAVQGFSPDLVVLDIRMPVSGRSILRHLKKHYPGMPVLIYSAYSGYKNDPNFAAADAFVVKSPDIMDILQAIEQIVPRTVHTA